MTIENLTQAELLERKANVVRSRLLRTIDALDQRRHDAMAVGENIEKAAVPIGAAIGGVVALAGTLAFVAHRASVRRRRSDVRYLLASVLAPPRPQRPSFFAEAARKVGLALIVLAANEAGKRVVHQALDGKKIGARPEGSLA